MDSEMNFWELSKYFQDSVGKIMDSERTLEEHHVKTICNIFKKFANLGLGGTEMKDFVDNVLLYFVFLKKYAGQFEEVSLLQYKIRSSLEAIMIVVKSTHILHYFTKKFSKIMNFMLDVNTHILYMKELIRVYYHFLTNVPSEISHTLVVKSKTISSLYNIVKNTCDIETQALIIGVVFKLFKCSDVPLTSEFLEVTESINIASINDQTVYQNVRMVLDKLNQDSQKIFSICCTTIEVNSARILEFSEAATTDDIWLDFDIPQKRMSFFCDRNYLTSSIHDLTLVSCTTWEVLSFHVKDIFKVIFSYDNLTENMKILIIIKMPDVILFADAIFGKFQHLEISISRYTERFEKLVQVILPKFFGRSFYDQSCDIPFAQSNNDSSVTADIDLDNSNEDHRSPVIERFIVIQQQPKKMSVRDEKYALMNISNSGNSSVVVLISDDEDEEIPLIPSVENHIPESPSYSVKRHVFNNLNKNSEPQKFQEDLLRNLKKINETISRSVNTTDTLVQQDQTKGNSEFGKVWPNSSFLNVSDASTTEKEKKYSSGIEEAEAAKRHISALFKSMNLDPSVKTGVEKTSPKTTSNGSKIRTTDSGKHFASEKSEIRTTKTSPTDKQLSDTSGDDSEKNKKICEVGLNSSQASTHGKICNNEILNHRISPLEKNNLNNSVKKQSFRVSVDTSKINLAECLSSSVGKRFPITNINDDNEGIIKSLDKVSRLGTSNENCFNKSISPELNLTMENEFRSNQEQSVSQFGKISQSDRIHLLDRSITPLSLSELHGRYSRPPSRIENIRKISTANKKLVDENANIKELPTKKIKSGIKISSSLYSPLVHETKAKTKKKVSKKIEVKLPAVEQIGSSPTVNEDVINRSLSKVKNWLEKVPDNLPRAEDPNQKDSLIPSIGTHNSERSSDMLPEQKMEILMRGIEENGTEQDKEIEMAVEGPPNKTVEDLLSILDSQSGRKKQEDGQMEPKQPTRVSFFSDDSDVPLATLANMMENKGNTGKEIKHYFQNKRRKSTENAIHNGMISKHADKLEKEENIKNDSFLPGKVISGFSRNNIIDSGSDDDGSGENEAPKKKSFGGISKDQVVSEDEDGTQERKDSSTEDHKDVSDVSGPISDDHLVPVQATPSRKRRLYNPKDLSYLDRSLTDEYMQSSTPKLLNSLKSIHIISRSKQPQSKAAKTSNKTKPALESTPKKTEAVLKSSKVDKTRIESDSVFDKLRASVSKAHNSSNVRNIRSKTIKKNSKKSKVRKSSKIPKPVLALTKKDILGDKNDSVSEKTHTNTNFTNILQSLKGKMRDHKKETKYKKKLSKQYYSSSSSSMEPFGVALNNLREKRKSTSAFKNENPKRFKDDNNSKQIRIISNILLRPPRDDERSFASIEKPLGVELSDEEPLPPHLLPPQEHHLSDDELLPPQLDVEEAISFQEHDRESIVASPVLMQSSGSPVPPRQNVDGPICCDEIAQMINKFYLRSVQHIKKCKPNSLRSEACHDILSILQDYVKK